MSDPASASSSDRTGRIVAWVIEHRRSLAVAVVVVGVVLWWWWPSLARDPARTDVVVVGDGQLADARDPIERRLRQRGLSVESVDGAPSWCSAIDAARAAIERLDPDVVVLSVRGDDPDCPEMAAGGAAWEDLAGRLSPAELVLVVQPGPQGLGQPTAVQDVVRSGTEWIVADPTPLLGTEGAADLTCQWWDDCTPAGTVTVREGSGALTTAGGERVARVIAAVVP